MSDIGTALKTAEIVAQQMRAVRNIGCKLSGDEQIMEELANATITLYNRLQHAISENFAFNVKVANEINELRKERDEWKRRAQAHGCDLDKGDPDCG